MTPQFDHASVTLTQEGNTLGTTAETESITIRLETQLPGEEPFYVLETKGWSFDDAEELAALVNRAQQIGSKI
jgi:hypothetical protein